MCSCCVFGASVTGSSHIARGLPCQDACGYRTLDDGSILIAVADGLGSAPQSAVGAATVVRTAVYSLESDLSRGRAERFGLGPVLCRTASVARRALVREARARSSPVEDLGCTLILVCARRGSVATAHVGDGGVVGGSLTTHRLLSPPGPSEYANEVVPLSAAVWRSNLRLSCATTPVDFLAVFADGCERAAFRKHDGELQPFPGFFGPLFGFAAGCEDVGDGADTITRLLGSDKMSEYIDDDKTLVLARLQAGEQAAWRE